MVKDTFTVSDKIHAIYHILAKQEKVYFSDLFRGATAKGEVIAIFLAILELMKMREVLAVQKDFFGEIEVIRNPEVVKLSQAASK